MTEVRDTRWAHIYVEQAEAWNREAGIIEEDDNHGLWLATDLYNLPFTLL